MIGAFVMTENELTKRKPTPDSVGMGSYTIDSHNVRRYVTPDGHVQNEGDIGVGISPYAIAYGSIVPKASECSNLLVPVACSASHIAYGSIRMEPVFMILGQSAATAAAMAIDAGSDVQSVPYPALRERLIKDGQVLAFDGPVKPTKSTRSAKDIPGVTVDDEEAVLTGEWSASSANSGFIGLGYRHGGKDSSPKSAKFIAKLPEAGRHEVRLAVVPNANRSKNALVKVRHAGGVAESRVDLTGAGAKDGFVSVGFFDFAAGTAEVIVSNEGATGYVLIDAVNWRKE